MRADLFGRSVATWGRRDERILGRPAEVGSEQTRHWVGGVDRDLRRRLCSHRHHGLGVRRCGRDVSESGAE